MWFVQFACVFLLLILLCNLPFCLLPLHFSLLVDFAQKVDLALLVHFFSVVEQTYIIYLSWSEFCMIWVIWKLPVGFSTVPSRCFLRDGTVPSRCFLRDGTVPSRCILRDGTVPSYNHYLKIFKPELRYWKHIANYTVQIAHSKSAQSKLQKLHIQNLTNQTE